MIDGNPERDEEKTSGETRCSDGSEREVRGINTREGRHDQHERINTREPHDQHERGINTINTRERGRHDQNERGSTPNFFIANTTGLYTVKAMVEKAK